MGFIPCRGTKIPHTVTKIRCSQIKISNKVGWLKKRTFQRGGKERIAFCPTLPPTWLPWMLCFLPAFIPLSPSTLHGPVQNPDSDDVCRGQNLWVYPLQSQQFLQYSCSGYSASPVLPHNKWPGKPGPDSQALTGGRVVEFRASPRPGPTPSFSVVWLLANCWRLFLTY